MFLRELNNGFREYIEMDKPLEEAAQWRARLQAPDCTVEQQAQFNQWLQARPENERAFEAVKTLDADLSALAKNDERLQGLADRAFAMDKQGLGYAAESPAVEATQSRQTWAPLALAASLLVMVVWFVAPDFVSPSGQMYASSENEQRQVELSDGSEAQLDINSAINVRMTSDYRNVELVQGRAIFDVKTDRDRPFSVLVGSSRVTAVGTRFQVHRSNHSVVVTLEEGSVDVFSTAYEGLTKKRLKPGQQLSLSGDSKSWKKREVELDLVTSWSRGRHVFRATPMNEAIAEVNRYATIKVRLGEPSLNDIKVSGSFILGDSHIVASAFVAALPVRMVDAGSEIILFPIYDSEKMRDIGGDK